MKKLLEIVKALWPFAKAFICADKDEAREVFDFLKPFDPSGAHWAGEDSFSMGEMPKLYYKIKEALAGDLEDGGTV